MELIVLLPFGFVLGWLAHRHKNTDYKKRWKLASKLLEEEKTKTITSGAVPKWLDAGPVPKEQAVADLKEKLKDYKSPSKPMILADTSPKQPKETIITQAKLNAMGSSARYELEMQRLKAGKPPRDTLERMGVVDKKYILLERAKHGWD